MTWGQVRTEGRESEEDNLAEAARLAAVLLKLFPNLLQAVPTLPNPKIVASIMPMQLFVQADNKPYQRTDLADTAFAPPQQHD